MVRPDPARLQCEHPAPDLQELIANHGSYDRITPEAWAAYDRELDEWRAHVAFGDHRSAYRYRGLRR